MRKLKPSTVKTEKRGFFGLSNCGLCGKEEKFVCVECYLKDHKEFVKEAVRLRLEELEKNKQREEAG